MHSFNATIASEYGVNGAIMIHNIHYWVNTNRANERNFYDGRHWTYNSVKAFDQLFPYWSSPQIRRILDKLVADEAIVTGNYNKMSYDQTKWYALSDKVLCYYDQIHLTKLANGIDEIGKPIPYSKPVSKHKEIKERKPSMEIGEVIAYLNTATGCNYRPNTAKYQTLIASLLRERFTVQDMKDVIDHKNADPYFVDNGYVRPTTLFKLDKFQEYLQEAKKSSRTAEFIKKKEMAKYEYQGDIDER